MPRNLTIRRKRNRRVWFIAILLDSVTRSSSFVIAAKRLVLHPRRSGGADVAGGAEEQQKTVNRARKVQQFLSQSFHVAEKFTGNPGDYCTVEETVRSFAAIIDGKCDDIPEQAFRYAGTIDDVRERASKMAETENE